MSKPRLFLQGCYGESRCQIDSLLTIKQCVVNGCLMPNNLGGEIDRLNSRFKHVLEMFHSAVEPCVHIYSLESAESNPYMTFNVHHIVFSAIFNYFRIIFSPPRLIFHKFCVHVLDDVQVHP